MTQHSNLTALIKQTSRSMMKNVATSTPGHIIAFDKDTQLAQVQIGIVRLTANGTTVEPPPIIEVPVYFSGSESYFIECEINPNCEGIVLFSQRCIDGWNSTGGIAQNPILRFHDFNDAMFLPGLRSQPNAIQSFENNGIRLRNKAGTQYAWLKNDDSIEFKNSSATMVISADGAFNGTFTSFNVDSDSFTHNGVNVGDDHKHESGTYVAGPTPVTLISGDPQ